MFLPQFSVLSDPQCQSTIGLPSCALEKIPNHYCSDPDQPPPTHPAIFAAYRDSQASHVGGSSIDCLDEDLVHEDLVHEDLVHEDLAHEDLVHEDLAHEDLVHENLVHEDLGTNYGVREPLKPGVSGRESSGADGRTRGRSRR